MEMNEADSSKRFPIGCRVTLIKNHEEYDKPEFKVGATGIVLCIDPSGEVGIRWDKKVSGFHDFWGEVECDNGHGWYVDSDIISKSKTDVKDLEDIKPTKCLPASQYIDEMLGD